MQFAYLCVILISKLEQGELIAKNVDAAAKDLLSEIAKAYALKSCYLPRNRLCEIKFEMKEEYYEA